MNLPFSFSIRGENNLFTLSIPIKFTYMIWLSIPSPSSIREAINITPDISIAALREDTTLDVTFFSWYINNDEIKRWVGDIWLTTATNKDKIYFQGKSITDSSIGSWEKIWLDILGCHTFIYELDNYIYIIKDVFVIYQRVNNIPRFMGEGIT